MARFQKFRPRRPHGRYASRPLARGFGALAGRIRFGGQRRDALIEASGAGLEILAPFPGLLGEEPGAAQQEVREPERAPQVERDGQGAENEQDLRRAIEPVAVRRHPIPGRLQRVASLPDRRSRRLAVQKPEQEGEREGDDFPEEQPRLAAVGPYRPDHDADPAASAHGRDVARQMAVALVGVRSDQSETAQLRFDRSPMGAREDVEPRAGGVEGERVGETGAFGLDLVALGALALKLPDEIVMAVGSRPGRPVRIAARMANLIQQARIVDAARRTVERGIGGAGDRHRRLGADRSVDPRQRHALKRLPASRRRSAELFDRLRQAPQRECLAGAGRPRTPPETASGPAGSRKDEPAAARSGQRSGGPPLRPIRQGKSAQPGREKAEAADRNGRRGRRRGGPAGRRTGRLFARPDLPKQANLRIHAWLGQSILLVQHRRRYKPLIPAYKSPATGRTSSTNGGSID